KSSLINQKQAEDQLEELNALYNIVCNPKQHYDFLVQITKTEQEIKDKKKRQKLKQH
ncbi:29261_t:CDS:1, partial [Gigaspora margarita]